MKGNLTFTTMQIFSGVKYSFDAFCLKFGQYLLEQGLNTELNAIVKILMSDQKEKKIIQDRVVTEYYLNHEFKFKLSQVQTREIYQQLKVTEDGFHRLYGIHLVIQHEKSGISFYLGEEIIITEATRLQYIQPKPHVGNRLRSLLREDVHVDLFVLV